MVCNMQISSCGMWEFLTRYWYRCGDGGVRESTDPTHMTRSYISEMVRVRFGEEDAVSVDCSAVDLDR